MARSNLKNRSSNQKPLGRRLAPWIILVVILFFVGLVVGNLKPDKKPQVVVSHEEPSAQVARDIILYFAASDGQTLVAETTRIDDCAKDEDCVKETVQSLIAGSKNGLVPIIPMQTTLLGVSTEDSVVTLDFSQDLIAAHPGGTQSELLTVYGLADTLAANFPHLRQVRIFVEGAPIETLKGHVDLRQPVYPDFSFVEEGAAPIGKVDNAMTGADE